MKLETYKKYYRGKSEFYPYEQAFTEEEGLKATNDLCGCTGKTDCDCVSVVNKVQADLWYNYNTREKP